MAKISRQFDAWAATYEKGRLAGWYQAQTMLALEHFRLSSGGKILDVGCATGWTLRHLAARWPSMTGLGIDISSQMIAAAQAEACEQELENIEFLQLDWEGPGAIAGAFDVVLCLSTFHYFSDPGAALERMRSALSADGQLLLVERAVEVSLFTRIWDVIHRWLIRDHVSFITTTQLEEMARKAGFSQVTVLDRINCMMWKNKLYTSLVLIEARI